MKKKNNITFEIISKYRTLLMGLAIISILIFHFTEDCFISGHNYNGLIRIYKIVIGSSGVDIFLLLSGLGLYYSYKKNNNPKEFYIKRLKKVLIPYFIIALPALFIKDIILDGGNILDLIKNITFVSLFTNGTKWHWYIFFICICYLIFPYLFNVFNTSKDDTTDQMRLITLISFITIICILLQLYSKEVFSNINIFMLRFTPFICGVLLGKYSYNKKEIKTSHIIISVLAIPMIFLVKDSGIIISRYILFIVNSCLFFIGTIILNKISSIKIAEISVKIIEWFGKYSLEIYLVHVTIRTFFNRFGLHTYLLKNEAIFICISLVISILLNKLSSLIIKKVSNY